MGRLFFIFTLIFALGAGAAHAGARVESAAVPAEMKSPAFTIRVNGKTVDVAHAAANYEYASFTMSGPVEIEITAT